MIPKDLKDIKDPRDLKDEDAILGVL